MLRHAVHTLCAPPFALDFDWCCVGTRPGTGSTVPLMLKSSLKLHEAGFGVTDVAEVMFLLYCVALFRNSVKHGARARYLGRELNVFRYVVVSGKHSRQCGREGSDRNSAVISSSPTSHWQGEPSTPCRAAKTSWAGKSFALSSSLLELLGYKHCSQSFR